MRKKPNSAQSFLFLSEDKPGENRATVSFLPVKKKIIVRPGTLLLDAAMKAGLPVAQSCGAELICGWCKVKIESGSEFLSKPTREELLLIEREKFRSDERASCATFITGGEVSISATYW